VHVHSLWLLKVVTLEFFTRLVGLSGKKRYTLLLRVIRISLAVTFLAIVIADLAECQPFAHYWQVVPDPGGRCRQGYAQLITATAANVFTDLILVVFPVPIVVRSRLSRGRKALLVMLFCLHLFTVLVAVYRVPEILREGGYQATRTMWASAEILMATFAANALTIGTFVRDTGAKKKRLRYRPNESEVRSAKRDSRAGPPKKVSWNDPDSDGDEETAGRGPQKGQVAAGRNSGDLDGPGRPEHRGGYVTRTESLDSLIPRSRFNTSTPDGGGVIKTTTIEVTVSHAAGPGYQGTEDGHGLLLRPADGVVTASARGRVRGSSIPLKDLEPLSEPGMGDKDLKEN
jgi:hypothetical protein